MTGSTGFVDQDWLITPATDSETAPGPVGEEDESWLLALTGVAVLDRDRIRRGRVGLRPDLTGPLREAIAEHGIPVPPDARRGSYHAGFQVNRWSSFGALASLLTGEGSAGPAVDVCRPRPFMTVIDVSGAARDGIFDGVEVDLTAAGAGQHRLRYSIVLVGRFVFTARGPRVAQRCASPAMDGERRVRD